MDTYFVSFRKQGERTIRIEVVIAAASRTEARQIANREMRPLSGFVCEGVGM